MEQAAKYIEKRLQSAQRGKQNTMQRSLGDEWVSAIFAKFRARYAHQWTSRFASAQEYEFAKIEWGEVLATMTGDQIKRGLDHWEDNHPPNAYEFRKACKEPKNVAAHKPYRALPKPKGDPEIAVRGVGELKAMLGMSDKADA